MLVAIDGPGGVGKSTVARAVAEAIGGAHLDTGATYRAAALAVIKAGEDPNDGEAAWRIVADSDISYEAGRVKLDGIDVTTDIRSAEVTAAASAVAVHPGIRRHLVALQRAWLADHGGVGVVEGRDIGTVVFPHAQVKVYLTASAGVRASRRAGDVGTPDVGAVASELAKRDRVDSTRETSPLQPATDALIIDTSEMSIDEVIGVVLEAVAR